MAFNAQRFLDQDIKANQYSPFGLDHHACPFSTFVIGLGSIFISSIARNYTLEAINGEGATKGLFHWQPNSSFTVKFHQRS